jgi:pSer/pThr/pTyr-binding forkhead associated (FHA) protein
MPPAPAQPQPGQGWGQANYPPTAPPPAEPPRGAPPAHQSAHGAAQRASSAPPPAPAPAQRPSTQPAAIDPEAVDPHAPRALAGFLVSYEGNDLGVFFPIVQGQNLVGRKAAAPGLHIELEHGTTSSRHAMLLATARPGRVKIEDLGSTNGTFVGDLMLERGKKHELKDGDVVRFGGYVTIVKIV